MSSTRPKRKVAVPKNYLDTANEAALERIIATTNRPDPATRSPRRAQSTRHTPPKNDDLQRKLPYNWQPPPGATLRFSVKLVLEGAFVNPEQQTLTCPNHPVADSPVHVDYECKTLDALIHTHTGIRPEPLGPRRKPKSPHFTLRKGDFIYMVSEPPGEPYYIGRIMGFTRKNESETQREDPEQAVEASAFVFQIQWFYRPRDILKHTTDLRLLYASMHSDVCPLSSFRGVATVLHRLDVDLYYQPAANGVAHLYALALEYYASFTNCFYFDKLFDRYMIKFYDIVKTSALLPYIDNAANHSQHYLLALSKRYEFVFMEPARSKPFVSTFDSTLSSHCDVCAQWCAPQDSVTCLDCEKNFHMLCLDPPLMKKPLRGFSWTCALCTKKHEVAHHKKKILMLSHDNRSTNAGEISSFTDVDELVEEKTPESSDATLLPKYEQMAIDYLKKDAALSTADRRLKEEWSLRYLGLHVRLEDAVDPEDRTPYPRASTSLGTRYQASNIPQFEDHPIVYYDPKKTAATTKKKTPKKPTKKKAEDEALKEMPVPPEYADTPAKDYPHWLQPRPKGYIERGVDDGTGETCTLLWRTPEVDLAENCTSLDAYVNKCAPMAAQLDLYPNSPNFMDYILKAYLEADRDHEKALAKVFSLTRAILKEPTFSREENRRFEAAVKKFGSELHPVSKAVKSQSHAMVVRHYYVWKKTRSGRAIWGNFSGRKRKPHKDSEMKIKAKVDDYADSDDDSAYENDKIDSRKKLFRCKHCRSYELYRWFKITGFDGTTTYDDTTDDLDELDPDAVTALCFRCARLWRRYAVYWEDPIEVDKKNTRGIGGYRKKVESELAADAKAILDVAEKGGMALSYESLKPFVQSSVLPANGYEANVSAPKPAAAPMLKTPKPESRAARKLANGSAASVEPKVEPKPSKAAPKAVKTEANGNTKRRKVVSEPAKKAPPKKRPSTAKSDASQKKVKKETPEVAVKKETTNTPPKTTASEKPEVKTKPAPNRRRKTNDITTLASPVFNPAYNSTVPTSKEFTQITSDVLEDIILNFKIRQLTDMKALIQGWQAPNQAKIDLPFDVKARPCCVCFENDKSEPAFMEMLICCGCGVNVHGSCAGIAISGKQKPVKQWLCDACVNDLSPKFSTAYSCSLCIAKNTNKEMALLGSPEEKPDYLVPILDTKKWCHLTCAIFGHQQLSFRNVVTPAFISKDVLNATNTKSYMTMVESLARAYTENRGKICLICQCQNGALLQCDNCDNSELYHITCAQDSSEFRLGFKLSPTPAAKQGTLTIAKNQTGKLEPIVICPRHDGTEILQLRELGKRTPNGESKPLIQLFLEDLSKTAGKLSGPQLAAHNYIAMVKACMEPRQEIGDSDVKTVKKTCKLCSITSSPMWWPAAKSSNESSLDGGSEVLCRNCHHVKDDEGVAEREGDDFFEEVSQPLFAPKLGIKDENDNLINIYKPNQRPPLPLEAPRPLTDIVG